MTREGDMRKVKLSNNWDAHIYDTGEIDLFNDEKLMTTTASDLAYLLQEFQKEFGGIPISIDWSQFRGMIGTKK